MQGSGKDLAIRFQFIHQDRVIKRFMGITIKLFASLREQFARDELKTPDTPATVHDAWLRITGKERPANILAAVNHEYVHFDHPLQEGDEVAFFPPVTGG
ncbi:MAG: MoaD/ThiS family protein [Halothiobacillus sp.]|jgi:molybdopterin synthase sulfur carrier subunit